MILQDESEGEDFEPGEADGSAEVEDLDEDDSDAEEG